MQLNPRLRCSRWSFINSGHFHPTVIARALLDLVARIFRLGGRHDALRKVSHHALTPLNLFPGVIAPQHTCQHATAWHCDAFCAVPRRKAVVPPAGYRKGLMPPTVQSFAFIGADDEGAMPRFAAGFRVLELRANLLARRGGRPPVSRGSVNLEGEGPGESDDDDLHLNGLW